MRHIIKGQSDEDLFAEHRRPPTQRRRVKDRWDRFRKSDRSEGTRTKCLQNEQSGLCGYSEIDLINGNGRDKELGFHLEHIEPKCHSPHRTFDHDNLIVCAIDDKKMRGFAKHDVFGGHARLEWWNPDVFIHPLRPDCARYFHYEASSGRVVPNANMPRRDRAKARLTIYKLNLNAAILVNWRRTWLAQKAELIETFLDQPEILKQLARQELLPHEGILKPFHSAVSQLFGSIAEEILAEMG